MKKKPSEYWTSNCVASGAMDIRTGYDAGAQNLMFGADIPHSKGTEPFTKKALRLLFQAEEYPDFPVETRYRMFDVAALGLVVMLLACTVLNGKPVIGAVEDGRFSPVTGNRSAT